MASDSIILRIKDQFEYNTFDRWEFTKIELLLFGSILFFLPVLFGDFDSPEIVISWGLVIAFSSLLLTYLLSHYRFTSYTPWLEKMANDKQEVDKKILKRIDEKENYKNLVEFYESDPDNIEEPELTEEDKKDPEKIEDHFFGDKPKKDEEWWYEVFLESLDYQIYDTLFRIVYPRWYTKYYPNNKADKDRLKGKLDTFMECPDLVAFKRKSEIKKIIEDALEAIPKNGEFDEEKTSNYFKNFETNVENNFEEDTKSALKTLGLFTKIFRSYEENKDEIKKLIIKKAIIDFEYFAIMVNFRRALENATALWLEADFQVDELEEKQYEKDSKNKNAGATLLQGHFLDKIRETGQEISDAAEGAIEMRIGEMNKSEKERKEELLEKLEKAINDVYPDGEQKAVSSIVSSINKLFSKDEEEKLVENRMEFIKEKISNKNEWDSDDWRAMGSIYYKWKESERKKTSKPSQKSQRVIADLEILEKAKKDNVVRAVSMFSEKFGPKHKEGNARTILFFGVIFGLIAATALTNSLDILIDEFTPDTSNKAGDLDISKFTSAEYFQIVLLFIAFFPTAIIYYHSGTIFLSSEASDAVTAGDKRWVFVNFLIIVVQAILIYFLASSIGNIISFLGILVTLVAIDAAWVGLFTWVDSRTEVRDAPIYLEWGIFDLIVIALALVYWQNYESLSGELTQFWSLAAFVGVLGMRAVIDYTYAWRNFWSLFGDAE